MSTSAVTPPPGFELERGEHLAVTPPPGFELESQSSKDSIQLPPGFELEKPAYERRFSSGMVSKSSPSPNAVQRQTNFGVSAQPRRANVVRATGTRSSDVTSRFGQARDAAGFAPGLPSASWRSAHPPYTDSSGQLHTISGDKSDDQIYRESKFAQKQRQTSSAMTTLAKGIWRGLGGTGIPDKTPSKPQELAAGERVRRIQTPRDQEIAAGIEQAMHQPTAQEIQDGLFHESSTYKAGTTGGRKPINAREAMERGYPTFLDRTLGRATNNLPQPELEPAFDYLQGYGPEIRLRAKLSPQPLPGETPSEFYDRLGRIMDEARPNWLKAARDYPQAAAKWGHDTAADAAELYLHTQGIYNKTAVGITRETAGFVGGLAADPTTYLLMGTGTLPKVGQRLMAVGFSYYMGKGALRQAQQLREAWNDPSIPYQRKVELATALVLSTAMFGMSAKHSVHANTIPLDQRLVKELDTFGPQAKQDILEGARRKLNDAVADKAALVLSPETSQKNTPAVQGPIVASGAQLGSIQFKAGDYVQSVTDGRDGTVERILPRLGLAQVRTRSGKIQAVRLSKLVHGLVSRTGEWVAATYDVFPIRKGQPTQQEAAILGKAPRRPAQGTGKSRDFQIKTCGPMETLIQGGGEEVWADDLEISDGMARDAKYVRKVKRSMYVEGSEIDPEFRVVLERDTVGEFRRYAAVIQDPKSPIRALEVITSDRASVSYFLKLMKRFGIAGHIVIK